MTTSTYIVRKRGFEQVIQATGPCEAIGICIDRFGIYGASAKRVTLQ